MKKMMVPDLPLNGSMTSSRKIGRLTTEPMNSTKNFTSTTKVSAKYFDQIFNVDFRFWQDCMYGTLPSFEMLVL